MSLVVDSRFPDPDAGYRALVAAHRGLDDEASAALNSRLVLILANHIGDLAVLEAAIGLARLTSADQSTPTAVGDRKP